MTATYPVWTDEEIIAKHSEAARPRARIELRIVNAIITRARALDYALLVNGYEDAPCVKSMLFDLDDAHLEVSDAAGRSIGWIRLVFGNDGWDLVSDYTLGLEDFLAPIMAEVQP